MAELTAHLLGLPSPLWQSLALSLRLAAVTTLVLGCLGLPLAQWLNTCRWRGVAFVETVVALPLVLPPTVLGYYLLIALSPVHAPGSWWRSITGHSLALLDAGTAQGAAPWRVWLRLHLPLAKRGIAAGLTLAFAHTLGEFGVVLMIGGSIPGVTRVASIALYDEVQSLDYDQARGFAAVLLGLSFVLLLMVTLLQRRSSRP